MGLDLRTMMVMVAILCLLLAGLLALVGLHAGHARGVRQWALANLCIGLGLGLAISQTVQVGSWLVIPGATLIALGMGLQYGGLRRFLGAPTDRRLPWVFALLVGAQTLWFTLIQPDAALRAILNSLAFALISLASARRLFVRASAPLRTAYWLTGASFALLALVFCARAIFISLSSESYGLYAHVPINPLSFFLGSITQLGLTFGFVLMLNYRLADELQTLASVDALTGAYNRRSLEAELAAKLAHCSRKGEVMAAMMIDVDHFKAVNDTYGHIAGDEVLRRLAAVVKKSIRANDYFARYGGEEFSVLLPSTSAREAWRLAERLRQTFGETVVSVAGQDIRTTISIGIADSSHAAQDTTPLLDLADRALYRAKQEGRNRTVVRTQESGIEAMVATAA